MTVEEKYGEMLAVALAEARLGRRYLTEREIYSLRDEIAECSRMTRPCMERRMHFGGRDGNGLTGIR